MLVYLLLLVLVALPASQVSLNSLPVDLVRHDALAFHVVHELAGHFFESLFSESARIFLKLVEWYELYYVRVHVLLELL